MKINNRKFLIACVLCFMALALPFTSHAQKATPLVIQGGTLIDGTGRPPLENAVIVIEGERIKAVGRRGEVAVPGNARVVDVKGRTILSRF